MKTISVLQIVNSLGPGGAENLARDISIELVEHGIRADVLLLKRRVTQDVINTFKSKGIKIYSLSRKGSFYNPFNIFFIGRFLKNYSITHVHLFPAFYWVALARLLGSRKSTLILTEHSTQNRRRNNFLFRFIDSIIYKQYKYVVSISEVAKKSLEEHLGTSFSNIITINNGVKTELFKSAIKLDKAQLNLPEDSIILTQVSRFYFPKDHKTLIRSLNHLSDNFHLVLVGDGPLLNDAIKYTNELGLSDRVHFLGNRDDVPRLLKSSDIIILSSEYEGLSLFSIEAMASGKPFIASNVPGLKEIVNGAGILFELKNDTDLADKIKSLMNNKDYYDEIVRKCLERADLYTFDKMMNEYISLYHKCIN